MSSKNRNRKPRTTASTTKPAPAVRPVPDQTAARGRTDAEDKLWKALHATHNSTATELSTVAKIGKSTAQKILTKWAADGSVTRTAGNAEGKRASDRWTPTEADTTPANTTPVDNPAVEDADATDDATDEAHDPVDPDTTNPNATDPVDAEPDVAESADPAAAGGADGEPANSETTDSDTTTNGGAGATAGKAPRLAPGALQGMVEDYLRDHPGEQFGPTAIAKALGGKSSGAVSNALDKLVKTGVAAKTQDKPRRFALAEAEQEAVASTK